MKLMIRMLSLAIAAALLPCHSTNARSAPIKRSHVVIVSFDGGKPAVMQVSPMPVLMAMSKQGATTWSAQTVNPPITLVSHMSMLTGVTPERHHIWWNDWIPTNGMVGVPSVFTLAKAAGLKTALFAGKEKFCHFDAPGALDTLKIETGGAMAVAQAAAAYIRTNKPGLCVVHFADTDAVGHTHGWGSPEQVQAFAVEDQALDLLRRAVDEAGIKASTTFILTADHGGLGQRHDEAIPDNLTIPWIASGARVKRGYTITNPVSTCDSAATALWLLGIPVPADWNGKPVTNAFAR